MGRYRCGMACVIPRVEVEWVSLAIPTTSHRGKSCVRCCRISHSALQDGKRFAVVGGLGNGGSYRGVWIYASDNGRWTRASQKVLTSLATLLVPLVGD